MLGLGRRLQQPDNPGGRGGGASAGPSRFREPPPGCPGRGSAEQPRSRGCAAGRARQWASAPAPAALRRVRRFRQLPRPRGGSARHVLPGAGRPWDPCAGPSGTGTIIPVTFWPHFLRPHSTCLGHVPDRVPPNPRRLHSSGGTFCSSPPAQGWQRGQEPRRVTGSPGQFARATALQSQWLRNLSHQLDAAPVTLLGCATAREPASPGRSWPAGSGCVRIRAATARAGLCLQSWGSRWEKHLPEPHWGAQQSLTHTPHGCFFKYFIK